ncbi:MAG TPA: hypothetical protein PKC76_08825 [Saprospiraceae bacterium]|nr:hypothetical protein [Saprospiraceae bacterium]HMP24222.1 hypothetical protein [Saprospiraceae bacterium]
MDKKNPKKNKPKVHEQLEGFDIRVNEFGEIIATKNIEELNEFLNENVDDKKLRSHKQHQADEEE